MRTIFLSTIAGMTIVSGARADVTFESSDKIVVVRVQDLFGCASVEVIAHGIDMVTCILLDTDTDTDTDADPIAVATGFVQDGARQALANDVDVGAVSGVQCNGSKF